MIAIFTVTNGSTKSNIIEKSKSK